jgi:hypothetical protein
MDFTDKKTLYSIRHVSLEIPKMFFLTQRAQWNRIVR